MMMKQIPAGINKEAWEEWLEFRRLDKKSKVGPVAAKKQTKLLLKYTEEDQQKIIATSINGGWSGLFELKGQSNERNQSGATQGQNKRETARHQRESDLERLRQSTQHPYNQGGGGLELAKPDIRPLLGHAVGANGT